MNIEDEDDLIRHISKSKRYMSGRVNARHFGFNTTNSTSYLTAALSSVSTSLRVPYISTGPWITDPLTLRSNFRLELRPGARLLARVGGYGAADKNLLAASLLHDLSIVGSNGESILEMNRENLSVGDDGPHCLNLLGCSKVTVDGIYFKNGSGDGINIDQDTSGVRTPCSDVVVRNSQFTNNRRQGISVNGGVRTLIENCVFTNNGGSPNGASPKMGIDIEPPGQFDVCSVTIKNCKFYQNNGCGVGVLIERLKFLAGITVAIDISGCGVIGGLRGFRARSFAPTDTGPPGTIDIRNFSVSNTTLEGIWLGGSADPTGIITPADNFWDPGRAHRIRFTNGVINTCATSGSNPILIELTDQCAPQASGGIEFNDVTIVDNQNRTPVQVYWTAGDQTDDSRNRVRGNIKVINPLLPLGVYDVSCPNLTVTVVSG